RRHTRFSRDWSSDVCSSDLVEFGPALLAAHKFFDGAGYIRRHLFNDGITFGMDSAAVKWIRRIVNAKKPGSLFKGLLAKPRHFRSEERRVGKEGRTAS